MFRPLEIYIGLRYTRAKRRNHFISFISFISIFGIAIGVTALITVMSVMNGFEKELRGSILRVASHNVITAADGRLDDWRELVPLLQRYPEVAGYAPFIRAEGMLSSGGQVAGTMIRGILPELEPTVSSLGEDMETGALEELAPGDFTILLGKDLAARLGVTMGDRVTLITPQGNVTPVGVMPRLKRFTVAGIFDTGNYEYDSVLALIHLEDAARLFHMKGQVTGVRLKLHDLFDAPALTRKLVRDLPLGYLINDWTRQHVNFFKAVQTEKMVMFVILTLIVGVAAFNIVSTLVMVVTDKQADIAILRTLGMSPGSIMAVFMVQGVVIGTFGALLGVIGGVTLAQNVETIVPAIEQFFNIKFIPGDVYMISKLPSDMRWSDVIEVGSVAFILCLLATIYPAWRASRTQPAEALRYE